jgi:hypothetical protein
VDSGSSFWSSPGLLFRYLLATFGEPWGPSGASWGSLRGQLGHPGEFESIFVDFRVPEGAPKKVLPPPGGPKKTPREFAHFVLGAGPGKCREPLGRLESQSRSGATLGRFGLICHRFGSILEALLEPFLRHFCNSVRKLTTSRNMGIRSVS